MAITCPRCGAGFDVTLFQFGHAVRCDCGAWVELARGHVLAVGDPREEDVEMPEVEIGKVTHYFGKIGVAALKITAGSTRLSQQAMTMVFGACPVSARDR